MKTIAAAAIAVIAMAGAAAEDPTRLPVYADVTSRPTEHTGPVRVAIDPSQIETVPIGLFLPVDGPRAARAVQVRRGAELAVREANLDGGLEGTPFALVERTEASPWGSAREVVALVYEDRVWAITGAIGGESAHVVQQVVTKAHVPMVVVASTDASLTQVNIPWTFRLLPDDEAIAVAVAGRLPERSDRGPVVSVATSAYDARRRAEQFAKIRSRSGEPVALSLFLEDEAEADSVASRVAALDPRAVAIWGTPAEGAALTKALRRRLTEVALFGGPGLVDPEFLRRAGPAADGMTMITPVAIDPSTGATEGFREQFEAAFAEAPEGSAAAAYDGTRVVIAAIRRAGLHNVRIRDEIAATNRFEGIVGTITFDGAGAAHPPVGVVVVRGGAFAQPSVQPTTQR